MSSPASRLLLFTLADSAGGAFFRPLSLKLSVQPGTGQLWLDPANENAYSPTWQQAARNVAAVGRRRYELPWETTDLHISPQGRKLLLDGRSASLPLFVAWVALLMGRPLPVPFLATGVVFEGQETLAAAPRDYIQGKLGVADAYVRQVYPSAGRVPMWVPEGSEYDPGVSSVLEIRPVVSLTQAVEQILGLAPRPLSGSGVER
ncbi:MAG: hypothetical protein JXB05_07285 [Myxococcaceae bacterium]|nr:hypothetical protein [Myxococcaceae bacterium]